MAQFTPSPSSGYLVGGALRDALLGRSYKDIDWVVENPEAEAHRAAERLSGTAFPLDVSRGHWRVAVGAIIRDYAPIGADIVSNLAARDYTVNALAADLSGRLIDPVDGLRDLRRKRLRMVSPVSLAADPVRPLRGVRLAAQLGFKFEAETRRNIFGLAVAQRDGAARLPAWERVGEEMDALLLSERAARGLAQLDSLALMEVYLPELALTRGVEQRGFHHLDVLNHSLEALRRLLYNFPTASLSLRWATLLHDLGKPVARTWDGARGIYHFYGHDALGADLAETLLSRLRRPQERIRHVRNLVRYHMLPLPKNDKEARRFVHRRRELLPDLLKLMIADREASRGPLSNEAAREAYKIAVSRVLRVMEGQTPVGKSLLDGHEIMALLKLPPGPEVGRALAFIREAEAVGDIASVDEATAALRHFAARQGWLESL